jgi:ATP-dependent protease ClpP protease subunit
VSRNTPWRTARKMWALNQPGHNDWYRIKNQINGPTQLHIYDEIGYFGVTASDMIRDLADVSGPLEVHVNSPGGEVFEGLAIYNALMARKDVTVMIDGMAASIASVIAMAGNPVIMARQSQMMIHDGFAQAIGNAQDLRDLAEHLERSSNQIAEIYSEHTGKPKAYWRELMKAETWLTSQEAIDIGLADRMADSGAGRQVSPAEDTWDLSVFKNSGKPSNAAAVPYVGERQTRHEPMTGRHRHDHSAFEAGDHDDGLHFHMHAHSNDADHNHPGQHDEHNHPDDGHGHGTYGEDGMHMHAKKGSKPEPASPALSPADSVFTEEDAAMFLRALKEV